TPAVVSIVATKDVPVIEEFFINPFEDFVIPQYRQRGTQKQQFSLGSGFLVSADGLLVTNRHVVEDTAAEYSVVMNDGKRLGAKVLALDPLKDIAVLKLEGENFPFISLGSSDNLRVGQSVIAIGNALGEFQNTVSVGVISGLSRSIVAVGAVSGPERLQQVIQTDAAINPGNSGGPLLDITGRAIGINTALAQGAENIGFALPINAVKKAVEDVKTFGKVRYPFLGVRYIIINPALKAERKLSMDYGALITAGPGELAVLADSPAKKAGLQQGDIILEFDGMRVDQDHALGDLIASKRIGDTVKLKVLRDGKEIFLEAALEERAK
ncbi:MAG: trypsin-like peptidase domain-containing protein, partial [Patescibacteria group bacterium]